MSTVLEAYMETIYWLNPRSFEISGLRNKKYINSISKSELEEQGADIYVNDEVHVVAVCYRGSFFKPACRQKFQKHC
jgi:hypothetical protein